MRTPFLAALLATGLALGPAEARDTGRIFVSNEKSHDIYVFDHEFNLIKQIETSRRPRDMHLNADRTLLYVACGDDDVIDVIDVDTLEVVDSIPTGPSPEVFAFSPDESQIYVSNEEDSMLEVIDLASRIVVHDVPTGAEPEGVIATADGATIYVTSEVADMVHVVDAGTGAVVDNIIVGTRPRRFVLTPDTNELWVSAELSSEIYVIDRETDEIKEVLEFLPPGFRPEDVTPVGMAVTADGSRGLISLGRANHIAVIDAHSKEVIEYVLVGERAWSVALNRDESLAVVANGLSDDITLVDMETLRPVRSIPVGRVPHTVVIDD
ncbi:PQQ-dependent catabolism-associated beta-propeller protein [Sinisalibacter aestuarii]|uniref:Membrane protein n=1 Tax=Sinisalibacter aestuarii TaxID=2949426 RepID=A0ABQ5LTZ6_9RHOB|nr:PQQ-dependent catabolism-associated beta-propeller protein [Sinisalibacter aestuarii]GKY88455.1 membrane protein [Sinisalibacter aestuarii]